MDELYRESNNFSFKTNDSQLESKAVANAMRALQIKIKNLESEKQNMQSHINYLLETAKPGEKQFFDEKSDYEAYSISEKLWKLQETNEILMQKSEFLEKELKRKEQQYSLDRDTWELEQKNWKKYLKDSSSQSGVNPSKKNKLKDLNDELSLKIASLSSSLASTKKKLQDSEYLIEKNREEYDTNLCILQQEILKIKDNTSKDTFNLYSELEYHKELCNGQKAQIENLENELEYYKTQSKTQENPATQTIHNEKAENIRRDSSYYRGNIAELEKEVIFLNKKYKNLLEKTRNLNEDYPLLRSELQSVAYELEIKSSELSSLIKNQR